MNFKTDNLIPCREIALREGSETRTVVNGNGKFLDLLSFYKGQWHYIATTLIKN